MRWCDYDEIPSHASHAQGHTPFENHTNVKWICTVVPKAWRLHVGAEKVLFVAEHHLEISWKLCDEAHR